MAIDCYPPVGGLSDGRQVGGLLRYVLAESKRPCEPCHVIGLIAFATITRRVSSSDEMNMCPKCRARGRR